MYYHSASGKALVAALVFVWLVSPAPGAYLRYVPQVLTQPDGEILRCFATGDEHLNWLHDARGYTIIQDPTTGFYVYAARSVAGGLRPTVFIAGRIDPAAEGLEKDLRPPWSGVRERRADVLRVQGGQDAVPAPRRGTINNIVIFIRFQDEGEFTDAPSLYEGMFNAPATSANSLYNYFRESSYGALNIPSTFYPTPGTTVVSYRDIYPRAYYKPYNAATNPTGYANSTEERDREHVLLKNAVTAVASQVPAGLNLDGDADGRVDNVVFIVSGTPTAWASLLWPHMWSLYSQTVTLNGKRVWTYNFQIRSMLDVGVLCHEMFHSLGSPDLYHYQDNGISPAAKWDIMDWNLNPPQHMSAFMKWRYGTWISSLPEISTAGTYSLQPLTSSANNVFKIRSPVSTTEYFVVEYRKRTGAFESSLPDEGLIVTRINSARDGQGNASGPPDEVYVYRPNGTTTVDGSPDSAPFRSGSGRTAINDATNPSSFLSTGSPGGLNISNIGTAGATISFAVSFGPAEQPQIQLDRTKLAFGASPGMGTTSGQTVSISNSGVGILNWSAAGNQSWISVAPAAGTNTGVITVSVNSQGLGSGTYSGKVIVSDSQAGNSPQNVDVTLSVYGASASSAPFGYIDTPQNGANVSGSVPITGWALDDVEVAAVKIWRNPEPGEAVYPNGYVYVGQAVFIEGARPDVEQTYGSTPLNRRAGWGYMMLTNMLPRGGNGTFYLHATAADKDGHEVELGARTILADNANAVRPFGTIDTPTQGGTASGTAFVNFAWALTPTPKSIPVDGSTMWVWIDGAPLSHPSYNHYRSDIATLFPGYANSNGAVGYATIDTTKYANGLHTIAWSIKDSGGIDNGIGSRFFTITNPTGSGLAEIAASMPRRPLSEYAKNFRRPVSLRTGFRRDELGEFKSPERDDVVRVEIEEIGRVEISLNPADGESGESGLYSGAEMVGEKLRPLPAGSHLDSKTGIFRWQPGPGFIGPYHFVFVDETAGLMTRVTVIISPKRY